MYQCHSVGIPRKAARYAKIELDVVNSITVPFKSMETRKAAFFRVKVLIRRQSWSTEDFEVMNPN
jgi:hypothetical protein